MASLALIASCVHGQTTAPALDAALLERLEAADAKGAAIKDLTAAFEQKKFSALLKKPLVSRGTIYAVGDAMLWKTETPAPTRLRIDGQSLQLLDLKHKTLEIFPLQGKLAAMASGPLPRLAALRERFDLAPDDQAPAGALALKMTPRDAELARYVARVRVRLNESLGVVEEFELTDPDGERTLITFTDPKPDTGLDDKAVAVDAPAGTTVSRPMDAGSP